MVRCLRKVDLSTSSATPEIAVCRGGRWSNGICLRHARRGNNSSINVYNKPTATALNTMPQALSKLSAQAEDLGAANLGDLEGFAKDMSEEVSKLRQASKAAITPAVHPFLHLNYTFSPCW